MLCLTHMDSAGSDEAAEGNRASATEENRRDRRRRVMREVAERRAAFFARGGREEDDESKCCALSLRQSSSKYCSNLQRKWRTPTLQDYKISAHQSRHGQGACPQLGIYCRNVQRQSGEGRRQIPHPWAQDSPAAACPMPPAARLMS